MPGIFKALAVMMPDDGGTFAALCPVSTCRVAAGRREHSLRVRAGQHVMRVHRVATTADDFAFFTERGGLVDIV